MVGAVGCFEPGDDGDSDGMPTSSTTGGTGETSMTSGDTSTSTTTGADTTSTTSTGSSDDGGSTTSAACMRTDECTEDADCEAEGATCVDCMCVGGVACMPGMCATACTDCDACSECAQSPGGECNDESVACENNLQCNAAFACVQACPTDDDNAFLQCFAGCLEQYPDGEQDFTALWNCVVGNPDMPGVCFDSCP
jgi:hypothetical protein